MKDSSGNWTTFEFIEIENLYLPTTDLTSNGLVSGTTGNDTIDASYTGDAEGDMVDANDNAAGNNDDIIYAGDGDDTVYAGAGDDSVYGGDGHDTLDGGDGHDYLTGGAGNNIVYGGAGNDLLSGDGGNDVLYGGSGNDYFVSAAGNDTIYGGDGDDDVYGGAGDDSVQVGAGNDTVGGGTGNDTIDGGAGDDKLYGQDGNDSIDGGDGDDQLYGGNGDNVLMGGDGVDRIYGGAGNDTIDGGAGNDSILSYSGNDTIFGGSGADNIYSSGGTDTIYGGDDADRITVNDAGRATGTVIEVDGGSGGTDNDTLNLNYWNAYRNLTQTADADGNSTSGSVEVRDDNGNWSTVNFTEIETLDLPSTNLTPNYTVTGTAGDDTINAAYTGDLEGDMVDANDNAAGNNDDKIYGLGGDDTISAGSGDDRLYGGSGNDLVYGGQGNDTVFGDDGNDTIWGGVSGSTIYGDAGDDFIDADAGDDTIYGGAGSDNIFGDEGNDTIFGGDGNDHLNDGEGDDSVTGGAGDDNFYASSGNDTLEGGDDADTFHFLVGNYADGAVVAIDGGTGGNDVDTVSANGWDAYRNLTQTTDADGDSTSGSVELKDASGNWITVNFTEIETLNLPATDLTPDYIVEGTSGDDNITYGYDGDPEGDMVDNNDSATGTNDDSILAGDGNDYVSSWDGNDTVDAGAGDDVVAGGDGDDSISGGTGNDLLHGGEGQDTIDGGDGNDTIEGNNGDDAISGGSGDDYLTGDFGNDTVDGGAGNDTLFGSTGNDVLSGGDGNDHIYGETDNDTLCGGAGDDTLNGGSGNDTIYGGDDNDSILSGEGRDSIYGGSGNDTINAGADADAVFGGDGNDDLRGGDGIDSVYGGSGDDTIRLVGNFGNDTIIGGETGETAGDTLNLEGVTSDLTVDLSGADPEAGIVSDGTSTATFSEIENIILGSGADTVVLGDGSGDDTVGNFDMADSGDGTTVDQLDVSNLTTDGTTPVKAWDVIVTDTNGDGTGDAILTFPNGESITLSGVLASQVDSAAELNSIGIPCFNKGAMIETINGEVPIEEIRVGDLVRTLHSGFQPVRWAGSRTICADMLDQNPQLKPIVIRKMALNNQRKLVVSPQHGMVIDVEGQTKLIRAKHLAEFMGGKVARVSSAIEEVTYFHLMFDKHEVLFAEGSLSEAFYPGKLAMSSIDAEVRFELFSIFPELVDVALGKADVEDVYSEPAHPYLKRHEAKQLRLSNVT